jgi:hypothetical protein
MWPAGALVLVLAGCGASHGAAGHVQTVGAYGDHPATTVAAAPGRPAVCSQDAEIFARDARRFVAHSTTAAAYPADLYYMIIREDLADFQARGCDARYLGDALVVRLTPPQRRVLVADAPSAMAAVIRAGLARAGS